MSEYLKRVKAGEEVIITERGRPMDPEGAILKALLQEREEN